MKYNLSEFLGKYAREEKQLIGKAIEIKKKNGTLFQGTITNLVFESLPDDKNSSATITKKCVGVNINNENIVLFVDDVDYLIVSEEDAVISRRNFFRKAAQSAIPVISILALSELGFISCERNDPDESSGCKNSCYHTCDNDCAGSCKRTSSGYCNCGYNCSTGCSQSCKETCAPTCASGCTGTTKKNCNSSASTY